MKRIVAFLCTLVLTLGMTATLYAKPSIKVSGIVTEATEATDANGNPVEIIICDASEQYKGAIEDIKKEGALKEILGDDYEDGMQLVDIKQVKVIGEVEYPVTITFVVPGVTKNSKVAVLYYDESAGKWILVECRAGDGTITAVLPNQGLVAFVVDQKTAESVNNGSGTQNPSTGDTDAADILPTVLVAVLALTGPN